MLFRDGENADWRRDIHSDDDTWRTLGALLRWRLVVGAGALSLGLLLRPDVSVGHRMSLLGAALAVLVVVSGGYWLLRHWRRGATAQVWLQAVGDCALVTALAAATGGPDSQFVLFYVIVVLWTGVALGTTAGLGVALTASTGYLFLPFLMTWFGGDAWRSTPGAAASPVPYSPSLVGFLLALGAVAGSLGGRVRRTRQTLRLASREVERARLDTDLILENMPSGVLTLDTTGTVLHYNRAAEDMLGYPLAQVRGRWCQDVFGPSHLPLLQKITTTLETGVAACREEVVLQNRDGRDRWIGLSTSFMTGEDGQRRGVIAVFADLSEFKAVEERARRSETLAAIGQLSAGIAHEIRNCLNPISGSVEYLQRELTLEGENAHLFGLIAGECERLNRFVTELLDYAREPKLHVQAVCVNDLIGDAVDLLKRHPAFGPKVSLSMESADEEFWSRLDPEHFKRLLLNLLQNAVEAVEGDGRVTVRLRALTEERLIIEVADTGPGIPLEYLERVTEPFFTTKRGGTGLGLAIAARIVERLGGRLKIYSPPGAGTTFTIELGREMALAQAA